MKFDSLIDCKKCSLSRNCDQIDAISTVTDFKCIDSRVNISSVRVPSPLVW